ncbi:MAG: hypothetical protein ACJA0H_001067 [Francisellaceae bacterium]|jgi:hypothetical protein
MRVLDDTTNNNGVTRFKFSDGSSAHATQDHSATGAPFIVNGNMSHAQKSAIHQWSACAVREA